MLDEHLFDPAGFGESMETLRVHPALSDELALDGEPSLKRGDDGLLVREVALHSLDKAHYARYYADIVGRAMQNAYPGPLAWIELFSGPGRLHVKDSDSFEMGSPLEALTIAKRFDFYVFADLDPKCTEALRERVRRVAPDHPNVHVLNGNANAADLHDRILRLVPRNALTVLYGDPEGLDLEFSTLKFFADRYKHLDLLLNVPIAGAVRALTAGHEEKASRMLNHPAPRELIESRDRPSPSLREWFQRQLATLGYDQFATRAIKLHSKNVPIYDLMLASREERAKQFFQEAVKRGPRGQYAMDFGDC